MCGFDSHWVLLIQDVGKLGTPRASGARDRWFESSHPDYAGQRVNCTQTAAGKRTLQTVFRLSIRLTLRDSCCW